MCGIAGVYWFDRERRVDARVLGAMTDVVAHRGPDGRATYIDGCLGLGHRRLSIIDLSSNAAQPLANEDGTVWVSCNGEIYNFRELRAELVEKGHRFRSQSDNEVLVHLYEEMAERMIDRLRGMFAFALWDGRRRRLLLARDRFGQKPLYYRLTAEGIHFGSEAKSILQDPGVRREPDLEALDAYLTYGYVPAPATAFVGIRKLPAAHWLSVEADGSRELCRYWQLRYSPKMEIGSRRQRTDAQERVLDLLDEATRLRMISDVPLGALLSGGVDSSAIVASMCAQRTPGAGPPKTFSIGFDEHGFDESRYAGEVARHLGTEHHRLEVTSDAFSGLERIAWHYGEPFADSSCLPTFAVARLAREHVTVALTGDGGDELFSGYRRHAAMQLEQWLRGAVAPVAPVLRDHRVAGLLRRVRRKALAEDLGSSRLHRHESLTDVYLSHLEYSSPALKELLYGDDLSRRLAGFSARAILSRAIDTSDAETFAERCTHADTLTYLPDDILVKVDVASMAHGLECRSPLLDHVLAEYVAALPFRLKMSRLRRKKVFKGAVAKRLPRWVLDRRKKGFSVPLKNWFQTDMDSVLRDTLLSRKALERGYFRRTALDKLLQEHQDDACNHQRPLFSLLMLELWHQLWIDPSGSENSELWRHSSERPARPVSV